MNFFKNKRNLIIFSIVVLILYTALTSFISISIYKSHLQKELQKSISNAFSNAFNSNTSSSNSSKNGTVVENKKDTSKAIHLNETFTTKNWEVTISSVDIAESYSYDEKSSWDDSIKNYTVTAEPDEVFVLAEGKIKNIGEENESIDGYRNTFKVICNDKYNYTMTISKIPREGFSFYTSLDPLESASIQIIGNAKKEAVNNKITLEFKIDDETFKLDKQI